MLGEFSAFTRSAFTRLCGNLDAQMITWARGLGRLRGEAVATFFWLLPSKMRLRTLGRSLLIRDGIGFHASFGSIGTVWSGRSIFDSARDDRSPWRFGDLSNGTRLGSRRGVGFDANT